MQHCVSRLTSGFSSPVSTLLREPSALATLSPPDTDPQILERWGYAAANLHRNFVERRILVSKFGIAQHGFSETNTSDWFRNDGALP